MIGITAIRQISSISKCVRLFLSSSSSRPSKCTPSFSFLQQPRYGLFNFNQKKSDEQKNKDKMKLLQDQLKQYKEEKKFMIRKPFDQNYFVSEAEKQKQHKDANEAIEKYLKEYKFEQPFIETNFIELLSKISQTVENKKILERKEFQDLLLERAEKSYLFKDFRQFALFFSFCSVQGIDHPSLWECFNGFVASNYVNFSTAEKTLILQNVTSVNAHEFECFFEIFEQELLKDLQATQIPNFDKANQLLTIYRNAHQGSDDFFETIEQLVSENIDEISIPQLTVLATHYANNVNEKHESRLRMMGVFEKRILKIVRFINCQELIALFYDYIKIGMGSELLFRSFEQRIFHLIDDFNVAQITQLLVIASNRQDSKRSVFHTVEGFVMKNLEKLQENALSTIFFNFSENAIGSEQFYRAIEQKLVQSAHQLSPEMLAKCAWGFAMARTQIGSLFFKKAQEAALLKLDKFTVKDLSTLVWSFARFQNGDSSFFQAIEKEIQKRFDIIKAKDCAQLLWAYTQNHPLTIYTVEMLRGIILRDRMELDCWDLSIVLWSYTKFENYESYALYRDLEPQTLELIDEMTSEEFLYCFRSYIEMKSESKELVSAFLAKTNECLDLKNIDYDQVCVLLWGFTNLTQVEINAEVIEVIQKLEKRRQELQTLAVQMEEKEAAATPKTDKELVDEDKYRFSDPEFYKENLELEKIQNQKPPTSQ